MNSKKNILLFCTNSLKNHFIESIKLEGYNVIDFHDPKNFNIKNHKLIDKTFNLLFRVILKRKDYFHYIHKKRFNNLSRKRTNHILDTITIDYAIFFRADIYDIELIKTITNHSNYSVTYQCDGSKDISNKINTYSPYFNRIFSFNPPDVKKYGFDFLTNCFFNTLYDKSLSLDNINKEIYYLGMWNPERETAIQHLNQFLKNSNHQLNAYFNIANYRIRKNHDGIEYHTQVLEYDEYIKNILKKDVIIDIVYQNHKGLSFRFFEALYFNKKVITNNYDVVNYDFYNPKNIYICDFKNFSGLDDFLNNEYVEIDKEIINNYSFSNWLNTILNIK